MKKLFLSRYLLFFISIISLQSLLASTWADLEQYQETASKKEVLDRLQFLQHDPEVANFYTITDDAFYLYASLSDKNNHKPEFTLKFGSKPKPTASRFLPKNASDKPLQGLRVAIDPGHIGGKMARIEERFIDITLADGKHIQFDEGTLAIQTARVLRDLLEKAGATVLLTHEQPGEAVYAKPYANDEPFRPNYNSKDLFARADKVNAFKPHISIIIHYNAPDDSSVLCKSNYDLVFVPGSFLKNELTSNRSQTAFARLIATNDFDESVKLSKAIVKQMESTLNVPTQSNPSYQKEMAMSVATGIYSRNLTLTRLIESPLCYGETLLQSNQNEAIRLSKKDAVFNGEPISSRVVEVAIAYFQGICEYFCLNHAI